jgi:hypothetical protein
MNVETNIFSSITASQMGWTVILVRMYVETFKTDIIDYCFICNVIMYLPSHWMMMFSIMVNLLILKISDITLTDDVQYHGQSVDTENIWHHTDWWCSVSWSICWYWKYLTSHWLMMFSIMVNLLILKISDITLTDDVQYHGQSVDTENIWHHTEWWCSVSWSICWYWKYPAEIKWKL